MGLDMYLYVEVPLQGERPLFEQLLARYDKEFNETAPEDREDFLTTGVYISGWSDEDKELQAGFDEYYGFERGEYSKSVWVRKEKGLLISFPTVAYWRKVNQVHAWFVREVQNDVDECQLSDSFSMEKLIELRDLCANVIQNPGKASELLPTEPGFFFGSLDYDTYYFDDLSETVDTLTKIIENPKFEGRAFRYRSSW